MIEIKFKDRNLDILGNSSQIIVRGKKWISYFDNQIETDECQFIYGDRVHSNASKYEIIFNF